MELGPSAAGPQPSDRYLHLHTAQKVAFLESILRARGWHVCTGTQTIAVAPECYLLELYIDNFNIEFDAYPVVHERHGVVCMYTNSGWETPTFPLGWW